MFEASVDRQRMWDTFGAEISGDFRQVERAPERGIDYPLEGAIVNTPDVNGGFTIDKFSRDSIFQVKEPILCGLTTFHEMETILLNGDPTGRGINFGRMVSRH